MKQKSAYAKKDNVSRQLKIFTKKEHMTSVWKVLETEFLHNVSEAFANIV